MKTRIFLRTTLLFFMLAPIPLVLAEDKPDYRAELKQTQADLKLVARIQIEKIESESKRKLNDGPPENFPNCRRIDLVEYKKTLFNYKPDFETAVDGCLIYVPLASAMWRSLNQSLTSQAIDLEGAIALATPPLKDASASSPRRLWGMKLFTTLRQASLIYRPCIMHSKVVLDGRIWTQI